LSKSSFRNNNFANERATLPNPIKDNL
jgi:hypothetical protein